MERAFALRKVQLNHNGQKPTEDEIDYSVLDQKLSMALEQTRSGNLDPMGEMLNDLRPFLNNLAKYISDQSIDREACVQEAFLRFWQGLEAFDDRGYKAFRKYLARSVKTQIIDNDRRMCNRFGKRVSCIPLGEIAWAEINSAFAVKLVTAGFEDGVIDNIDDQNLLLTFLDEPSLDGPRERNVLYLQLFEDLDTKAIAQKIGCSESLVRISRHRGLGKLRKTLVKETERTIDGSLSDQANRR